MVQPGDYLAGLIVRALDTTRLKLEHGDILSVCQKIISKAEGRLVSLDGIEPSALAIKFAARWDKDPRAVELVLRQTSRIVRMDNAVLIVETGPGWVCANAGIDESNSLADNRAILLPEDADASAARLRAALKNNRRRNRRADHRYFRASVARWLDRSLPRNLGLDPMLDLRGTTDLGGRELHHTVIAIADELAAAAGLLMPKAGAIPPC